MDEVPVPQPESVGRIIVTKTIPLTLKYLAGAAVMTSVWMLVHQKLIGADTYLVYVSSILTALGVSHVLSKKDQNQ